MVMLLSSLACAEVVGWSNREVVVVGCSHVAVMTCTCSLCEKKVRGRAVTLLTCQTCHVVAVRRCHSFVGLVTWHYCWGGWRRLNDDCRRWWVVAAMVMNWRWLQ